MQIIITGGLGFVGRVLTRHLLSSGHRVTALGRNPAPELIGHDLFRYIAADTTEEGDWQESVALSDAIINLAGRSIFKRWDAAYKQLMVDSRILTTRHLVSAMSDDRDRVLLSTSAVGYYGDCADAILTEADPWRNDFLGTLARDWETEALKAESKGARVALMRFGIILGKGGGALGMMLPAFKMFVGGPLGNGKQWFPWIHMADVIGAIDFLLENETAQGPFNFSAPEPVRNREMVTTLGRVLNRPSIMPAPAFMVKLALGELGEVLMASTRAVPDNLLRAGFSFRYSDIENALLDLVNN